MQEHLDVIWYYLTEIKFENSMINSKSTRIATYRAGGYTNIGKEQDRISYCKKQIKKEFEKILKKYNGPYKEKLIKIIDSITYMSTYYDGEIYEEDESEIKEKMQEIKEILNGTKKYDETIMPIKKYNGPCEKRLKEIIRLIENCDNNNDNNVLRRKVLTEEKDRILNGTQERYEKIEQQYKPLLINYHGPYKRRLKILIKLLVDHKFNGDHDSIRVKRITAEIKKIINETQKSNTTMESEINNSKKR